MSLFFKKILNLTILITLFSLNFSLAKNTLYEKSINNGDYKCKVWITKRAYEGSLPGVEANQSPQKWYINIAFFKNDDSLERAFSFPAALVVSENELDAFKPSLINFISKTNWDREFLTIENNGLFKYQVWAEKDPSTGKFHMSADFGKRIPIFIPSKASILDLSYTPWTDDSGNIYFKTLSENERPNFFKWNSKTEKIESCREKPQSEEPNAEDLKLENPDDENIEIIDPLSIREDFLLNFYQDYGTDKQPVAKDDIDLLENSYQMAIGKIIALNKLYKLGEEPVVETTLSDDQKDYLRKTISEMASAYSMKKDLLRELKLVMREKGVMSILRKWLTNLEFNAILTALNPEEGGGGVISKFDHTGKTEIKDGQLVLALGYYRMLKEKCRKGFDKNMWEEYSPEKAKKLKRAIQGYCKKLLKKDSTFKNALNSFMEVREQKNWIEWFEKNRNIIIELLFDYLAALNKKKLNDTLEKFIPSKIKRTRLVQIVDAYKKSNLCSGAKESK